jgi:hypothetical protein
MFEHHREPLLAKDAFARRLARSMGAFAFLIAGSLAIGIVGYHTLGHLGWVDATLNASMILTGMGPVSQLPTAGAKLFASAYALFSAVVFLVACGVGLAPVMHRFLHRFHLDLDEDEERRSRRRD